MNLINPQDLAYIFPELILTGAFLAALLLDMVYRGKNTFIVVSTAVGGLLASALAGYFLVELPATSVFGGMVIRDNFTTYFQFVLCAGALATVLISANSREINDKPTAGKGEYYVLILAAVIGMYFLVGASNLLMLYLAMELLSLTSYLLTGWLTRSRGSTEAGLKYVIYGAAASCAMIYGISLLYGVTGSLSFEGIRMWLMVEGAVNPPFIVAVLLVFTGFMFKIAAFPMFQWAPDVYQGAPTPIAAFLAVGSKTAGVGALVRFLMMALSASDREGYYALANFNWPMLIAVISAATMTIGNFMALGQNNIKRLLAYSSIAHAGYILMGIPVMSELGIKAIAFYMAVYLIMNLGAFLVVVVFENKGIEGEIPAYRGLGGRAPAAAVAMAIFLFSLTGVPPFAGFIGKIYIFAGVIESKIYWLALIGIFNSVVSLYYYMRIVKVMFLEKADESLPAIEVDRPLLIILWCLAVPTVVLGLYWEPLMNLAASAARVFGK